MASARDKRSGAIYKRREALESKFDQDFEAEQRILKLEREKQAKNAPASSNLMMTCDDEDPFADLNNATIVNVLKMMTTMSRQIGQLTKKVDTIQKEVDDVKTRLLHVELALHATLSMVENVKDLVTFSGLGTEIFPFMPDFDFNPISTEEELNELNDKLGTDAEYMTNLTNWLNSKIQKEDPNHRLTGALELVFRLVNMATARDRKTGKIYKIRELLESRFEQEYEAEQRLIKMEREMEENTAPSSELMMTCDDEDPFVDPGEGTIEDVLKILNTVSGQIGQLNKKMDSIQKEVEDVSIRMLRVEKKVGTTLATVEQVKEVVTVSGLLTNVNPAVPSFEYEPVSNEEQLNELDYKLATDTEYNTTLTNWLNMKIVSEEPNSRLHEAMELVFTREFLPKCSWKGRGKPEPKIPMSAQTHIMKMFAALGSNRFIAITDAFVAKFFLKKLPHAKERLKLKKGRNVVPTSRPDSTQFQQN
uniref:DUF4806 domain-containing protein n=1 Tax=Anopheles christyi TaxID=43041 RepID=A0A182JY46_9DIPT